MKIGSVHIGLDGIYREKALDIDAVPMFGLPSRVEYKLKGIKTYYDLYKDHDLVRGMIDDLSESACGQGIYTTVENLSPVFEKNRGKELCDDFAKKFNLDEVLPKVAKNTLIAGYCPVETKLSPDVEKCSLKVVHPETVVKIVTDPVTGEVLQVEQKVKSKKVTLLGKNLAWFTYGNLANDPRGTSFVQSILQLLTTLDNATNTVSKIAERYIAPIGVAKSRGPSATLKEVFGKKEDDNMIFLGSLTAEEMKEDLVKFYQVDPRVPFWEYMEDLQLRIYAYSRASNVWYTKNANLASAEKMEDIVARHVASIQRNIKRIIEKSWFTPLIEMNGFNLDDVPRVNFGREPTGVEDITPSDIITKGLELGYISQAQYYEILRQMGVKITESLGETPEKPEKEEEKPEETGEEEEEEPTEDQQERMLRGLAEQFRDGTREIASTVGDLRHVVVKHMDKLDEARQENRENAKIERDVLEEVQKKLKRKRVRP